MHARLLWWSLRHRRSRHVVNAIAMAVTIAVVMVFVSVFTEFRSYSTEHAVNGLARILVTPKIATPGTSFDGMPMAFYSMFKDIPGVQSVQRRIAIRGQHPSGARYILLAEEDAGVELNADLFPVPKEMIEAWKKERPTGAIVTEAIARDLNLKVGDTADIPTSFGPLRIKVVGVSKGSLLTQSIGVHLEYIQEFTKNYDTCGYRVFTTPENFGRVATAIDEQTKNSPMPTQSISSSQFREAAAKQSAAVPTILGFLGIFLMFTTALTLANNSAISIRERRTEAATLRVLGFYRSAIVRLFVSEVVIVALLGGLIAVVVMSLLFGGKGISLSTGALSQPGVFEHVKIGTIAIVSGVITAIVVPLAGALPSALASVRIPLVDGLRDTA